MAIQHVNRKGKTYYLHQGKTKTGKTKYFMSGRADGELAESIPEGFEIHEDPNALVSIRKVVPTLVTPEEVALVQESASKSAGVWALAQAEGEHIVVHLREGSRYTPMFRFTLVDEQKRRFAVERWCFRGSIDDWFPLLSEGDLKPLVKKTLPHLGKESFYEMF